jgi:hypothetical protein
VRYVVALMMLAFLGSGLALLVGAARTLAHRLRRRPHLRHAEGTVVEIHRETRFGQGGGGSRSRPERVNFPVVTFQGPAGDTVTFRSEVGDTGESRFRVGQPLRVSYDPAGELPPMIGTGLLGGLWMIPLMFALGGLALTGGALMIWLAFGEQILGR